MIKDSGALSRDKRSEGLTKTQRDLLAKLKIAPPKKIIEATPAAT